MTLQELIRKVKDKELSKEQLEAYRDDLVNLFAELQFELADIRKAKALFFLEQREKTDIATERKWQVTKEGLREIELRHYSKACEKIISSTKDRLYRLY